MQREIPGPKSIGATGTVRESVSVVRGDRTAGPEDTRLESARIA